MAVTGAAHAEDSANLAQIEKVIQSQILHGSESLCKLLRYLAEKAIEQPGVPVKEYQVATEVFGRSGNFDPRLDSTVRVQTGRLRSKLGEYYTSVGHEDPVVVEIPKGAYLVTFQHREHSAAATGELSPAQSRELERRPTGATASAPAQLRGVIWILAVSLAVALSVIALLVARGGKAAPAEADNVPPSMRAFWKAFLGDAPDDPLVVFSNAAFVGRPETGLRYFKPDQDSRAPIMDHYTGVGEVQAIHDLDYVFGRLKRGMHLERGQLISLDDVKNNNVVFVGSPSENLTLRDIPGTHDFVFQRIKDAPRAGDLGIFNVHPQPGEAPYYLAAPETPLSDDYAVIARVPGINPTHTMLILAGTTTLGTQAAAEYVCHANSLDILMRRLARWKPGSPFEAVLHVKITRGVPVQSDLVAVHSHPPPG